MTEVPPQEQATSEAWNRARHRETRSVLCPPLEPSRPERDIAIRGTAHPVYKLSAVIFVYKLSAVFPAATLQAEYSKSLLSTG